MRLDGERDADQLGGADIEPGGFGVEADLVASSQFFGQRVTFGGGGDEVVAVLRILDGFEGRGGRGHFRLLCGGEFEEVALAQRGLGHLDGFRGGRFAEEPLDEALEFEFGEEKLELVVVALADHQLFRRFLHGDIALDGDQPLGEQSLIFVFLDLLLLLAFELVGVFEQVFHRAKLGNELLRGLWSDARHTGNVVRGVARQPEDIDDLFNLFNIPLLQDFRHVEQLAGATHAGLEHEGVLIDELGIVLVGRDHIGVEALLFRLAGEGADHIVGLETRIFKHRNAEGLEQLA